MPKTTHHRKSDAQLTALLDDANEFLAGLTPAQAETARQLITDALFAGRTYGELQTIAKMRIAR